MKHKGFRERLALLVGKEAPYAWAARIGISKGAFARIWNEGTVPSSELLGRIKRATGVSIDWLLTGEPEERQGLGAAASDGYVQVPVYDVLVSAGGGTDPSHEQLVDTLAFKASWVRTELRADPRDLVGIWVHGDSMSPTLVQGDLVLVDRAQRKYHSEGIYVFRLEGLTLIKRLQSIRPGVLQVRSDNPAYSSFELRTSEEGISFKIIGRVIWASKRL